MKQKGFVLLPLIFVLVIVIFVGYFIYSIKLKKNQIIGPSPVPTISKKSDYEGWSAYKFELKPSESIYYQFKYPKNTIDIEHFKSEGGEGEEGEIITSKDYTLDSPEKPQEGLKIDLFPFYTETPKSTPLTKIQVNSMEVEKYLHEEKGYTFITYYIPVKNSKYWSLLSFKVVIRGDKTKEYIEMVEKIISTFEIITE